MARVLRGWQQETFAAEKDDRDIDRFRAIGTAPIGIRHEPCSGPCMDRGQDRRRAARIFIKVIHRHRAAGRTFRRVSELVYVDGRPKAVLGWMDVGGIRTPVFVCDLDEAKLRRAAGKRERHTYYYDGVTVDPRFDPVEPPANGRRSAR